jgi:hypothetical protein
MGEKKKGKVRRLLTFKDDLGGEKIAFDILSDLQFTDDIPTQMNDTLVGYMLSGKLAAMAEERFENEKIKHNSFRGDLDSRARDNIPDKVTESSVRAYIESNEEYAMRAKKVIRMKRQYEILRTLNRAFAIKAELLRSRAADVRKEYDDLGMSPPSVRRKRKKGGK